MKDMTIGNEAKHIFQFTLPMLIGNFFQQAYNMVDSIIVGQFLGKESLAAVGVAFPILFLLISFIMGITMGFSVLIGQYFGAKQYDKVIKTIETSLIFSFIGSLIITLIGLLLCKNILELLKTSKEFFSQAKQYIDILFIGTISLFGYNTISSILRGLGDSITPLIFIIISTILNIILDLIFVIYLKLGVSGVSLATVISLTISFILGLLYLSFSKHKILQINYKNIKFDFLIFIKSIKIGFPTAIQQILVSFGFFALTRIVNGFGTNAMAAYTAGGRLDSLASMPAMNFSMAISSFVSQNLGANKIDRIKKGFISTLLMSTILALFISFIMFYFKTNLISIFNNDNKVIEIGSEYLQIVSFFYIFFSFMFILNGILRGAGDTLFPMFVTLFSLWIIRIPLSIILSNNLGTKGIWISIPVAWIIGSILNYIYFLSGKWKNKRIINIPVIPDK